MPVKLRLTRVGGKKKPFYRVVATDSKMPRDGRFIEIIGRYNPRTEPSSVEIDGEKAKLWLSRGAKPTPAVEKLLSIAGVIEVEKKTKKPGRRTIAAREAAKEAAKKVAAEAHSTPPAPAAAEVSTEAAPEAPAEGAAAPEETTAEAVEPLPEPESAAASDEAEEALETQVEESPEPAGEAADEPVSEPEESAVVETQANEESAETVDTNS